jgi:hypothetical protein
VSGFEILTITFSFIVGLGVAQVLRSVAYVVREYKQVSLHWIPFSVAALILFFHIQFWFGLAVVNSFIVQWSWPTYGLMLLLAIFIFLSGATVLPHSLTSLGERGLKEDFETRGRISLVFLALYLVGWIGVGMLFWIPEMWHLVIVNGLMAITLIITYAAPNARFRTALHLVLIAMTIYGALTVWTTPNLEMPM